MVRLRTGPGRVLLLAGALAVSSATAAETCATLKEHTTVEVHPRHGPAYEKTLLEYWSTTSGDLKPSCVLEPKTAEEVAAIVTVLNGNDERFAIKSGGHDPNRYSSSVDGGPLISTKKLNQVLLDAGARTVRIGPGNRWDDVSAALEGSGFSPVGGRIGNVGTGGLLLGGGLSFSSAQYGWAANSVIEYCLVLANGTIVNVTRESQPDLFRSLQGGGNGFGIVTSYLLHVYPHGDIWGGHMMFDATPERTKAILAAIRDFTEHYDDEKAGLIATANRVVGAHIDLWTIFMYYNGPRPPPSVFANFSALEAMDNTCRTRTMHDLLQANNAFVIPASVYITGTETIPLPSKEHGAEVLQAIHDDWFRVSDTLRHVPGATTSQAFQPVPRRMTRRARESGGDLIDLDDGLDRLIVELPTSFLHAAHYAEVEGAVSGLLTRFANLTGSFQASGRLPSDVYLPLFMNDANYAQDYFARLRPEMRALATRVRDEVDPKRLWKDRTGGFKVDGKIFGA